MASFEDHRHQVNKNLEFLKGVNTHLYRAYDWQVTVAFYVAVHLVNAHTAKVANLHYKSHTDRKLAINPENNLSIAKIPQAEYIAYVKLENLSKRSRYLCKEEGIDQQNAYFTHDAHLAKAIRQLDLLMKYFGRKYSIDFTKSSFYCLAMQQSEPLEYFKAVHQPIRA